MKTSGNDERTDRHRLADGLTTSEIMDRYLADMIVVRGTNDVVTATADQPWSNPAHDPVADMTRWMDVVRAMPVPPPPDIRGGSREVFAGLVADSGIEMRPGGTGIESLMGIPLRIDESLPENVIVVGARVLMRRAPGQWIVFPLSALELPPVEQVSYRTVDLDTGLPVQPVEVDPGR